MGGNKGQAQMVSRAPGLREGAPGEGSSGTAACYLRQLEHVPWPPWASVSSSAGGGGRYETSLPCKDSGRRVFACNKVSSF